MKFNTAIAAMMTLINKVYDLGKLTRDDRVRHPSIHCFARLHPHLCEELYHTVVGGDGLAFSWAKWPEGTSPKLSTSRWNSPVQINGKLRGTFMIPTGARSATTVYCRGACRREICRDDRG